MKYIVDIERRILIIIKFIKILEFIGANVKFVFLILAMYYALSLTKKQFR
ncbi:hypothetical protein CFOLD11_40280 [Clostridium folliculivorans]|uniref:Uncharacterized protein n=1 Tax=Clostridium folliculivorans TaxID=2886038 RepID=A0A9W5Y5P6_9CLOT|nr:hypothetical protein CFOLD11_40280 [Clostridium folliculivorans]